MKYNFSILAMYFSGIALIVSAIYTGSPVVSNILFGILFVLLALLSKTTYSPFKVLETRISALIWVLLAIATSFSAYLFGNTADKVILWSSIAIGLFNLFLVLISDLKLPSLDKE